jgi:hypothetical protein
MARKKRCYACERAAMGWCMLHQLAELHSVKVWPKAQPWLYHYFVKGFPIVER